MIDRMDLVLNRFASEDVYKVKIKLSSLQEVNRGICAKSMFGKFKHENCLAIFHSVYF